MPSEFEPGLRRLDALVSRAVREDRVPDGLIDRIFTASAADLPAPRPLPMTPRRRSPARTSVWGRLAMAASVALVASVAGWLSQQRHHAIEQNHFLVDASSSFEAVLASDSRSAAGVAALDDELAYLLGTTGVSSQELAGELNALFPELGM